MLVYGDPSFDSDVSQMLGRIRRRLAESQLEKAEATSRLDSIRALLIEAGQLEQAAVDAFDDRRVSGPVENLTDCAANAFLLQWHACSGKGGPKRQDIGLDKIAAALDAMGNLPTGKLTIKIPEGFAFYCLYPEQYIVAGRQWMADNQPLKPGPAVVVGIRSIGTTLSAVVAAALAEAGWRVHRRTVRPRGHPFNREVAIDKRHVRDAVCAIVVDEGPGLSGSSMAAAAAALARCGIDPGRISFFPGHANLPAQSVSDEVHGWWHRTRRHIVSASDLRWGGKSLSETLGDATCAAFAGDGAIEAVVDLSGGLWRQFLYSHPAHWPAVCAPFERAKYRCVMRSGRSVLWKFAGLGTSDAYISRLRQAASRGWTVLPAATAMGFVALPWIDGRPLQAKDAAPDVLAQIGGYIKSAALPALDADAMRSGVQRLGEMLYWNTREALGEEHAHRARALGHFEIDPAEIGAYGDGRLAPYEWLRTASGQLLKTDAAGHEADHTLVGRQSLIWDIAGAVIEWQLDGAASASLLESMGIRVRPDILRLYLAAYAAFRIGQCTLCGQTTPDSDEHIRLSGAVQTYRRQLLGILDQ